MHHHRFATVHLLGLGPFLAILALLALAPSPARAAGALGNIFEVRGIPVDVTAETAAAARARALAEGQQKAFRLLLERLTLQADRDRLPRLNTGDMELYVRDFGVTGEKSSAVRYIAKIDVRFRPKPVRDLLHELGLQFAETPSKPVVVLPVYQAAGASLLWDDPNPWARAWNARPETFGLVPTVMPIGDLSDIGAIGAEQAIEGDQARLAALARRYGASDTVVAQAVQGVDVATARSSLEVFVTRYGTDLVEQTVVRSYVAAEGEATATLLARAATDITALIEDNWKRDNLLDFSKGAVLAVVVPLQSLHDWLEISRRLARVAVVRETEMVLLSRGEFRVNLHFIGEVDQLTLAMEQADLALREGEEGSGWFLALTGRGT